MTFGKIDRILLLGGAPLLAELAVCLKNRRVQVVVVSSSRHLSESVRADGSTLEALLSALQIPFVCSEDVNLDSRVESYITDTTLGIGLGAAWVFQKPFVRKFNGRLLDFMGIPLPQLRGGAHYTWQILMKNRSGSCNLQVIEGGKETFHKGPVIKSQHYLFPASCRIPLDYFGTAVPRETAFLLEFLDEVQQGKAFEQIPLQEEFSTYYPFLATVHHGFINWQWKTADIETFICAFDEPYAGASTYLNGQRVFLKQVHAEYGDGPFHPFQAGLIYRIIRDVVWIATSDGAIVAGKVMDENHKNIVATLRLGARLHTPQAVLEKALQYDATYSAEGLTKKP